MYVMLEDTCDVNGPDVDVGVGVVASGMVMIAYELID